MKKFNPTRFNFTISYFSFQTKIPSPLLFGSWMARLKKFPNSTRNQRWKSLRVREQASRILIKKSISLLPVVFLEWKRSSSTRVGSGRRLAGSGKWEFSKISLAAAAALVRNINCDDDGYSFALWNYGLGTQQLWIWNLQSVGMTHSKFVACLDREVGSVLFSPAWNDVVRNIGKFMPQSGWVLKVWQRALTSIWGLYLLEFSSLTWKFSGERVRRLMLEEMSRSFFGRNGLLYLLVLSFSIGGLTWK